MKKNIIYLIILCVSLVIIVVACSVSSGSSSSDYSLHNKDGSLNIRYYNEMQDYFNKHPEKRP